MRYDAILALRNRHLADNGDPIRPAGTPALRFHVLGGLDLRGTGGDEMRTVLVQPKRLALFAYLALATRPRLHRRDSLFALFWPEADIEQARRSLRQSLHFLRQALGPGVLVSRGDEEVGVQPDAIWFDVREFERALDRGHTAEALALYRGNLLEGFHVTGVAPEFDQWLGNERARLRARAVAAATSLRDTAERSGNLSLAIQYAREVLRLGSSSDGALRWLMTLLDRSGDHAAALRAYHEFSRRLASELDTQPSPKTAALAERLRQERPGAPGQAPLPSGIGSPSDAGRPFGALEPPPDRVRRRPRWSGRETVMAAVAGVALLAVGVVLYRSMMGSSHTGAEVPAYRQLTFNGHVMMSAISPDGKSLAYVTGSAFDEPPRDTARLFVQDVGGGSALEIAKLGEAHSLAWFPDGSSVVLTGTSQGKYGVFRFPRLGGTPQILPGGGFSAISSDGARIASVSMISLRIRLQDLRSGDTSSVRIPGPFKFVLGVGWSPQGSLLAVLTSPGGGNPSLWTLASSGRDAALVVQPAEGKVDSWTWSGSGDAIYYVIKDQLWRVPLSATGQRVGPSHLLLSNTPINAYLGRNSLSVSAMGHRLAYTKVQGHANVWVGAAAAMPPRGDSPALRQVTTGTGYKEALAVSPDLQRVAYLERAGDGGSDIYTTRLSSGATERVTFTGTVAGGPVWSPAGSSLAFLATVDGQRRVAVVSANGGGAPRIFAKIAGDAIAWSPDGRIAYRVPGNRNFSLFDPTTGAEQRLVANDSVGWMFNPVFAPDGKRVVLDWNRADGAGLWIVSLVDGSQRMLPGTSPTDYVWGWTRNGQAVFLGGSDGLARRVAVPGGEGTVVARLSPNSGCQPLDRPQGLTFVCMVSEYTSDVWMVEHFDPAVRVPKK